MFISGPSIYNAESVSVAPNIPLSILTLLTLADMYPESIFWIQGIFLRGQWPCIMALDP